MPAPKPYIGGQAVIEGVMMRSPKSFVVAVRRPDGSIAIREQGWSVLFPGLGFLRWPVFRGAVVLLESLHNGFSALKFSAEHGLPPEEPKPGAGPKPTVKRGSAELTNNAMLVIATVLGLGLFIALPHLLTFAVGRLMGGGLDTRGFAFHLVDGLFRVAILVGYLFAISRTKDAQVLFAYHGAEHKAIWAYESGQPLSVESARTFSTRHPRCGTSFLFVVVSVAVLVHVALVPLLPRFAESDLLNQLALVLVKVPMAFPIAGLAYELQKLSARDGCPRFIRWLMLPGIWLQSVTTREPTDAQLEIAVLALERALAREEGRARAADGVRIYPSYAQAV